MTRAGDQLPSGLPIGAEPRFIRDRGRTYHVAWYVRVFASTLTGLEGKERVRRLAEVVAPADVYVWKVLRRDRGLSRTQTELALCDLLEPLMGGH